MHVAIVVTIVVIFLIFAVLSIADWRRRENECKFLVTTADQQFYKNTVDINKYMGKWFEVARLPNSFEEGCVSATAEYSLNADKTVNVKNTCYYADGTTSIANGLASSNANAKQYQDRWFKVSFFGTGLPNLLSNIFKGDYLILHITKDDNGNYQEAIVGSTDKSYLWILSRDPNISQERLQYLLSIVNAKGYASLKI